MQWAPATGILARFRMKTSLDYGTAYGKISNTEIRIGKNIE